MISIHREFMISIHRELGNAKYDNQVRSGSMYQKLLDCVDAHCCRSISWSVQNSSYNNLRMLHSTFSEFCLGSVLEEKIENMNYL